MWYSSVDAVGYMERQPLPEGARKEDRKIIVMANEASGNAYLEQMNREIQYHPTREEVNRMLFIRWLILHGKLSEHLSL
jgi:hypothetical protein